MAIRVRRGLNDMNRWDGVEKKASVVSNQGSTFIINVEWHIKEEYKDNWDERRRNKGHAHTLLQAIGNNDGEKNALRGKMMSFIVAPALTNRKRHESEQELDELRTSSFLLSQLEIWESMELCVYFAKLRNSDYRLKLYYQLNSDVHCLSETYERACAHWLSSAVYQLFFSLFCRFSFFVCV